MHFWKSKQFISPRLLLRGSGTAADKQRVQLHHWKEICLGGGGWGGGGVTSGIPEPHAYGAKALTNVTAKNAKNSAQTM